MFWESKNIASADYSLIKRFFQETAKFLSDPPGQLMARINYPDNVKLFNLKSKYILFKRNNKKGKSTRLVTHLSEAEKEAYYLYQQGEGRTAAQTRRYQELLAQTALQRDQLKYLDRAARRDFTGLTDDYERNIVHNLIFSRQALLELDREQTKKQKITFVFGVYRDLNRLKPLAETFTGENLLEVKCRQLDYLFQGLSYFDWQLLIAEDEYFEAAGGADKSGSTLAAIDRLLAEQPELKPFAPRVQTFYPQDLLPELNQYPKKTGIFRKIFASKNPLEQVKRFTEISHKGGIIHLLLRRALKNNPAVIAYTDSDISHNLGLSGLFLKRLYANPQADLVIASRRLADSLVVNKAARRQVFSSGFNGLVKLLTGLDVWDTQSGLKFIRPRLVRAIQPDFSEIGMSFDVELLKLAELKGGRIVEVPAIWLDSPSESKSSGQARAMFDGLLRVYKKIYPARPAAKSIPELLERLQNETEYPALQALAENREFTAFTRNIFNLLAGLRLKDVRDFVRQSQRLIEQLAYTPAEITPGQLDELAASARKVWRILRRSQFYRFLTGRYPQILAALELIRKDRRYLRVIFPLFFGENILSSILKTEGARAIQPQETLAAWLANYEQNLRAAQQWRPAPLLRQDYTLQQLKRFAEGIETIRDKLAGFHKPLKLAIVFPYSYKLDAKSLAVLRTHAADRPGIFRRCPGLSLK